MNGEMERKCKHIFENMKSYLKINNDLQYLKYKLEQECQETGLISQDLTIKVNLSQTLPFL